METGRGKKGKKSAWHLSLGVKDIILAAIGVVGLMSMSFTLGALAGRGDIYRAAYSWGLLNPEAKSTPQVMPLAAAPPAPAPAETPAPVAAAPRPAPATASLAALPGGPAAAPAAAPHPAAAKKARPAPIAGAVAPVPPPASAASSKKKAKAAQALREQKAREDQLHRERQDVARKLTFLNSFDTSTKPGQKKDKSAAKSQPAQVKVGTYRDGKTAQAKLAELQKKGIKATLKQGKDAKGVCYTLYRPAPAAPKEGDHLTQKKQKAASPAPHR